MADSPEKIIQLQAKDDHTSPYFDALNASGNVIAPGMDTNYQTVVFAQKLADGLRAMTIHDGPYYINCLEGKDRPRFACLIIEALAGTSYQKLETDFMKSYENYYSLTKTSEPNLFATVKKYKI